VSDHFQHNRPLPTWNASPAAAVLRSDSGMALNLLREYLQAFVLRSLHECEAFWSLAFLIWYLSQHRPVAPNLVFLQNAIDQTQGVGRFDAAMWRELVRERLEGSDMQAVRNDVLPFLERARDAELLNREGLNGLLA
jgi:hypothetical protein